MDYQRHAARLGLMSIKPMFSGAWVNGENPFTRCGTGNELHLEAAVARTVGEWTMGLADYHHQQITGDGGEGAVLGDFKGHVSALVSTVTWGSQPVSHDARWLHELGARNRVKADVFFVNLTLPLGG